jgi:hypothetical protein
LIIVFDTGDVRIQAENNWPTGNYLPPEIIRCCMWIYDINIETKRFNSFKDGYVGDVSGKKMAPGILLAGLPHRIRKRTIDLLRDRDNIDE